MDFILDDLPSTSQSTPQRVHEESQMSEATDNNSSRAMSSDVNITEIQELNSSASIDAISRRAQDMVDQINLSRTSDQKVMDSFQEKLVKKMEEMCQDMKKHMYAIYEENSYEMQVKLQQLSEVLESCSKLISELLEANQALAHLREGLDISQREALNY